MLPPPLRLLQIFLQPVNHHSSFGWTKSIQSSVARLQFHYAHGRRPSSPPQPSLHGRSSWPPPDFPPSPALGPFESTRSNIRHRSRSFDPNTRSPLQARLPSYIPARRH